MLKEFKEFISKGNVVDLAVAVVIGSAFGALIGAIVAGMITPLVGMIASKDFSEMTFEANGSVFRYGTVINAIITFLSVALVIFFVVVKPMNMLAERRKRGEVPADTPPTQEELLTEIRDLLASQPR